MQVPLYRHNLHDDDTTSLLISMKRMMEGLTMSTGDVGASIAKKFAGMQGSNHAFLTSSWCTAAMSSMLALGIGPGDEVIVPAMTFVGSANVVEILGAKAVFVDVDPDTLLMDIDAAINLVNARTKAVMPVHLYGQMVDVARLRKLLPSNIMIIEDCAHAIESRLDGYAPGTYGDVALYSFFQSKNLTTGEGGAVTVNDDALRDKIKLCYRYGVNLSGHARHHMDLFIPAEAEVLGMKANMPDMLAVLLEPQLPLVSERLARRREIYDRYMRELGNLPLRFPAVVGGIHAHHMFPIAVDPKIRNAVITYMYARGFKTTIHYKSVPMTAIYQDKLGHSASDHPNAYAWGESTLSLPIFPGLRDEEQSYVIDLLKQALDGSSLDQSL